MEFRTLQGVTDEDILAVFNLSFSDYSVPFQLTLDQLQHKMKSDKVHLDYSVGVFDQQELVAFILHGLIKENQKHYLYNGGTGVIPTHRGHGLTKKMYEYIMPTMKKDKIDYLLLEVISDNIPAIKSYEKTGYKKTRTLHCYKGEVQIDKPIESAVINELDKYDWEAMTSFWDIKPTKQNNQEVINALQNSNKSIGAFLENEMVGYLIYNPASKRVQQFAVSKNHRRKGIGLNMFGWIQKNFDAQMSIINVDEKSIEAKQFLNKIGLQEYVSQFEMKMEL